MRLTNRAIVLLVAGVLGCGVATGTAVATAAGLGQQGPQGAAGARGEVGPAGVDSAVVGAQGPAGTAGPTGDQGPRGAAYVPVARTLLLETRAGEYNGPTVTVKAGVQVKVEYDYVCDSYFPFFTVSWNGTNHDYDSFREGTTSGSGTQYLNPDVGSGHFEISTQDSCTWLVKSSQTY